VLSVMVVLLLLGQAVLLLCSAMGMEDNRPTDQWHVIPNPAHVLQSFSVHSDIHLICLGVVPLLNGLAIIGGLPSIGESDSSMPRHNLRAPLYLIDPPPRVHSL